MGMNRELDDIERDLVRHRHEHPPARDVNAEHERRLSRAERIARDFSRSLGTWTFVTIQACLVVLWILLNALAVTRHWDGYPFLFMNLILSFQAAFGIPIVLMAVNRLHDRDRLTAQQDFQEAVKLEEELKALMRHLEVQDEVMLQVLHRLERGDRELRRISRRMGLGDEPQTRTS